MGKATIVEKKASGFYLIKVDKGEAQKAAAIARCESRITKLQELITEANEAGKTELADSYGDRKKIYENRLAQLNSYQVTEFKYAWCADYTTDLPVGRQVATIELNNESDVVLIAPGGALPTTGDGVMTDPRLMTGPQAYFNLAIFTGWQKFKPTYRVGTVTAIASDYQTISCTLDSVTSSQRPKNKSILIDNPEDRTLTNIPAFYMSCQGEAFSVGDKCIVQYQGQNRANPRAIGFLNSPKQCTTPYAWRLTGEFIHGTTLSDRWLITSGTGAQHDYRFRFTVDAYTMKDYWDNFANWRFDITVDPTQKTYPCNPVVDGSGNPNQWQGEAYFGVPTEGATWHAQHYYFDITGLRDPYAPDWEFGRTEDGRFKMEFSLYMAEPAASNYTVTPPWEQHSGYNPVRESDSNWTPASFWDAGESVFVTNWDAIVSPHYVKAVRNGAQQWRWGLQTFGPAHCYGPADCAAYDPNAHAYVAEHPFLTPGYVTPTTYPYYISQRNIPYFPYRVTGGVEIHPDVFWFKAYSSLPRVWRYFTQQELYNWEDRKQMPRPNEHLTW